jgi:hypothetical protein
MQMSNTYTTGPNGPELKVTDPTELMRKGLKGYDKSTSYTDKPATMGFVLSECMDVKDEISILNGDVNRQLKELNIAMSNVVLTTMNKADVNAAIKAYDAEWLQPSIKQLNKTVDMTRERDIALLNNRYDHVVKVLDRITLGGAIMFGVAMFSMLFVHYMQP